MTWRTEQLSDAVTLHCGDCREILPTLDLCGVGVCSDPPYGIGYQRGSGGSGWKTNAGARAKRKAAHSNDAAIVGDNIPFDPVPCLGADDVILWGGATTLRRGCHMVAGWPGTSSQA